MYFVFKSCTNHYFNKCGLLCKCLFLKAEVDGLKWVRYVGPNSNTLETPKSDPVLTSYANLLNDG